MHLIRSFIRSCCIHRQTIRSLSTHTSSINALSKPNNQKDGEWHTIYKFPYIKAIVGLNRLKVHQAALTSLAVPLCMGLEGAATIPAGCAQVVAVLGITGTVALCLASITVGRNIVGFAYVDRPEAPTTLRISHPDFWGRRRNVEIPIECIVSQLDAKRVPLDLYINIQCKRSEEERDDNKDSSYPSTYKLIHRHGKIVRPAEFTFVFGEC